MDNKTTHTTPFGEYHLLKLLTSGSVAEILLAMKSDPSGRRFFIIKKLLDHIAKDREKMQAFTREANISTSLWHHNIVHGQEFAFTEDGDTRHYYLVLEYVFGKNLSQIMKKSQHTPLPLDIICEILRNVATGLNYAHTYCNPLTLQDEPIIHKDISPDNIIVSYNGEIKISDFGISSKGHTDNPSGKIAGKLSYMSPEQILNKPLDHRSDIYSLGVVFWECLTGNKLFSDRTKEKLNYLTIPDIKHPCEVNTALPRLVGNICMRCLELDPDNRFQTALALSDALIEFSPTVQLGTANMKNYLQQQFTKEYKNEAKMLSQAQELDLNQKDAGITHFITQATINSSKVISGATSSITKNTTALIPDDSSLKYAKSNEQTQPLLIGKQESKQLLPEPTFIIPPENTTRTTEIEKTSTIVSNHGQVAVTDALSIQGNRSINLFIDSSKEVTQTDYEITIHAST